MDQFHRPFTYKHGMNSSQPLPSLFIRSIGEAALSLIPPGATGRVMAVVSKATYLQLETDELLWLTTGVHSRHRRELCLESALPKLAVGDRFHLGERVLLMENGLRMDFSHAGVWHAPSPTRPMPSTAIPAVVMPYFLNFVDELAPAGTGRLIPQILSAALHHEISLPQARKSPPSFFNLKAIFQVIRHGQRRDFPGMLEAARSLVGLGEGLTPSGDDFLGGLFFCLYLLRQTGNPDLRMKDWNPTAFVNECKPRTNLVSYTLLKDNALGHSVEPLHLFANAWLTGRPESLRGCTMELVAVGASTGWDMLTGFLTGMCVTFP